MAEDLKVVLGVELDPAGLQSAKDQIENIKSNKDNKITFNVNGDEVSRKISSIGNEIKSLVAKPFEIKFEVSDSSLKKITQSLQELNNATNKLGGAKTGEFKPIDISSSLKAQVGDIKEYVAQLQELGKQYAKAFGGASGKIDARSFKYDVINDAATAMLKFSDAAGQAHSVMLKLNNVSSGNTEWKVVSQSMSESFKEIDRLKNELAKIEQTAFSGSKALTGDYESSARTEIEKVRALITEIENASSQSGSKIGANMEQGIDRASSSLTNLKNMIGTLQNIEWPSDKLAAKNVDSVISDYQVKIQALQKEIESFRINGGNMQDANKTVDEYLSKLEQLREKLSSVGDVKGSGSAWAEWKSQFDQLDSSVKNFKTSIEGAGKSLANNIDIKQLTQLDSILNNSKIQEFAANKASPADTTGVNDILARAEQLKAAYQEIQNALRSGDLDNGQFDALKEKMRQLDDQLKQLTNSTKIYQDGFKNNQNLENFSSRMEKLTERFELYKKRYEEMVKVDPSKASAGTEQLINAIQQMQGNVDPNNITQYADAIARLGTTTTSTTPQITTLGQALTQSFGGVGQYLARFTSAFYIINKGIQTVKSMANEVKGLNTSMTELSKVTTLSGSSMEQFVDNAYNIGSKLGRTGQDVVDATTTFSRAGYTLDESVELSKAALVMTNVGVDIPNMESAASDMISILKAFDVQAEESMSVIDKLYNVANKEPLDFGNITEMLVTAGGTLAQSGTSLEQTMGLLTGGFATMRDTSVANG